MHKVLLPAFGCVALMMVFADPADARERSHHRHVGTAKHSLHHSWRAHGPRYYRHGRRHRLVAWQQTDLSPQPFAWPWQRPVVAPRRVRQRVAATWQQPLVAATPGDIQPVIAPVVSQRRVRQRVVMQPVAQPFGMVSPLAVQQPIVAPVVTQRARVATAEAPTGAYASLVASHAQANGLPVSLVHRVIMRESRYNPRAISKGNYGIMQIRLGTARAMGYTGSAAGLLDPNTNMTYAVRYLAGAYRAAGGNHGRAVSLYARGYYNQAKRQGFSPYASRASSI